MPEPSHTYHIEPRRIVAIVGAPFAWIVLIAAGLHLLAATGALPRPRPAWDMDQTILTHQAEAAVSAPASDILLVGDSSCMMNLDAPTLGARSLATLSYLSFDAHAHMLGQYLEHHATPPHTVLLLMHPESLRRNRSEPYFVELLESYATGREPTLPADAYHQVLRVLGLDRVRDRILSRWVPRPLPPPFAAEYGFQSGLVHALSDGKGTLTQPGMYPAGSHQGNDEYRLADRARPLAEAFRTQVPAACRLVIGVTPIPKSFASSSHRRRYRALLDTLDAWLQPDVLLTDLPATLPDDHFASFTHLNQKGRSRYTTLVGDALSEAAP